MAYVCEQLATIDGVHTCVLWAEQLSLNELFGITTAQAAQLGLASALVIVVAAVFNKLGQLGDKSHD